MSSPPNSAVLPKKRPSLSVPSNAQASKRRKPSTGPSQLRQTSFPPPEGYPSAGSPSSVTTPHGFAAYSRSPSVESSAVVSLANGTDGGRGGGRKRKRGGASAGGDDTRSVTGSTRGAKGGSPVDEAEEEEDDGPADVEVNMEGGGMPNEAEQKQQREHLNLLLSALTDDQRERYDLLRRTKLKKETVRKLINQTLSQSCPANIITAVNGFTKTFISDILDLAGEVQREWTLATDPEAEYPKEAYKKMYPPTPIPYNPAPSNTMRTLQPERPVPSKTMREMCGDATGPLLPEHLAEALRRYKLSQENGGVGFVGLSLMGRENTAVRTGGRPLFR